MRGLLLSLLFMFSSNAMAEMDACGRVLKLACSSQILKDVTGQSNGGNSTPVGYLEAKKDFEASIRESLMSVSITHAWGLYLELLLDPERYSNDRPSMAFQSAELEKQAMEACSQERYSHECRQSLINLLAHESTFNAFATTDVMFKGHSLRDSGGALFSASWKGLHRPYSAQELQDIEIGTYVYSLVADELWDNKESYFKDIYYDAMDAALKHIQPSPKELNRLKLEIFPEVRSLMLELIGEHQDRQVTHILNKVSSIGFIDTEVYQSIPREKTWLAPDVPASFKDILLPNAYYRFYENDFTVLSGFLKGNTSLFGQLFIVAHEIGHAVDPCRLNQTNESTYWFPSLLREVLAVIERPRNSAVCEGSDPLGETVSDALASELFGRFLERNWTSLSQDERVIAVAQTMRPFRCGMERFDHDPHLKMEDRYSKVILKNSKIRKFLGCKAL